MNDNISRINLPSETSPAELLNLIRSANNNPQNPTRTLPTQASPFSTETIRYLLNTKIYFQISFAINTVLSFAILLLFYTQAEHKFSLETLEDDSMFLIYILIFAISFVSIWSFFLFISLVIFKINFTEIKIEDTTKYQSAILLIDIFYFNPGTYGFLIYAFYKNFFPTNLDLLTWNLISVFYFINFIFSNKLFFYTKLKVKYITNKTFYETTGVSNNKLPINRIRGNQLVFMLINLIYIYCISEAIKDTDLIHKYLLIGKGVYLLCKQIEFFMLNEMKFTKLNYFDPNRKEEKFLKNLTVKSRVKMVNLMLIMQKLFFVNYLIFSSFFKFFYIFPITLVYANFTVSILNEFKSYERVKRFYAEINRFPVVEYEKDSGEECIICTESFGKARRLPCGHHFHFFCIAKWLKKNPSKICPICRRDIFIADESARNRGSSFFPRSFGFRLENRLFSWLPNISFRVMRGPNNVNVNERNNLNLHIVPGRTNEVNSSDPSNPANGTDVTNTNISENVANSTQ